MKVAFLTLGCKVNYYETEKMAERLAESGFEIVDFSVGADIYVVNTCTVTNIADRKSRQMLSRARKKNPDAFIVACGCYVDAAGKNHLIKNADVKVDDLIRQGVIDIAIGNEDKDNIANILSSVIGKKSPFTGESKSVYKRERTRAFLKIQDGCNQFCTYCLIPYVRGGGTLHSAPKEDVLKEVRRLAKNGVKEVVLNGIHLSSYGVDTLGAGGFLELEGKPLLSLIEEVASIEGISRIRLGSLEPRIITESFAVTLSRIDKVCPHFHLSMQSGSDETLKRMNRHYTSETYKKKVGLIRKFYDNPAITTDVIVGFPGETDEEFQITKKFVEDMEFADLHVFKYSKRAGTAAAGMSPQVNPSVKKSRSEALIEAGKISKKKYMENFLKKPQSILFEEAEKHGEKEYLAGYNERYVRFGITYETAKELSVGEGDIATVEAKDLIFL